MSTCGFFPNYFIKNDADVSSILRKHLLCFLVFFFFTRIKGDVLLKLGKVRVGYKQTLVNKNISLLLILTVVNQSSGPFK